MAYRRRQGAGSDWTTTTFKDEIGNPRGGVRVAAADESAASSLAAKAIRASSAYKKDSSLSSAYDGYPHSHSSPSSSNNLSNNNFSSYSPSPASTAAPKDSATYEYTSFKGAGEQKQGFWGVLARKAKGLIDDNDGAKQFEAPQRGRLQMSDTPTRDQYYQSPENRRKKDNPALQKGLDAITSSLNYLGGTIGNALEEGLTIVENRTSDIIQETRNLQKNKKDSCSEVQNQNVSSARQPPLTQTHVQPQMQMDLEIQLKASRDVAMAMAAKAKLLLRELKTVKADLAFAKERCGQLEEENRILRESSGKGDNPEDDDLIRLQLETLLAEKARLAQENSVFARENRFLREIVEYHQLTMQDVVYLDENNEDVTEVYPINKVPTPVNNNLLQPSAASLPVPTPPSASHLINTPHVSQDVSPLQLPSL